jgi:hypothetical protein
MADGGGRQVVVVAAAAEAAPDTIALLDVVRALGARADLAVRTIVFGRGELFDEFAAEAPTIVVGEAPRSRRDAIVERLLYALGLRRRYYTRRARRLGLDQWRPGDVVYLHSVLAAQVLRYLPARHPTVLCRVDRRSVPLRGPLRRPDRRLVLERVDRFLADHDDVEAELTVAAPRTPVARVTAPVVVADPRLPDRTAEIADRRRAYGYTDEVVVALLGWYPGREDPAWIPRRPEMDASLAVMLAHRELPPVVRALLVVPDHAWLDHDLELTGATRWVRRVADDGTWEGLARDNWAVLLDVCDLLVTFSPFADVLLAYHELGRTVVPVICFEHGADAGTIAAELGGQVLPLRDPADLADVIADAVEPEALEHRRRRVIEHLRASRGPGLLAAEIVAVTDDVAVPRG